MRLERHEWVLAGSVAGSRLGNRDRDLGND
jgi:hypothetical protein